MKLRHRGYLTEAQYWRDKDARNAAEDFYKGLIKFLKTRSDELYQEPKEGGFFIKANYFWNHPKAHNVVVLFTVGKTLGGGTKMYGGLGSAGKQKVLIFPILKAPGDKQYLATRLNHDVVVHEVIHLLGPGSFKKSKVDKFQLNRGRDVELFPYDYYNDPSEWNAYWQEGASQFERLLTNDAFKKGKAREVFFGDGSLKQLMARTDKFWNKDFLKYMNSKTKRKFDKRLAELWKNIKNKGLL